MSECVSNIGCPQNASSEIVSKSDMETDEISVYDLSSLSHLDSYLRDLMLCRGKLVPPGSVQGCQEQRGQAGGGGVSCWKPPQVRHSPAPARAVPTNCLRPYRRTDSSQDTKP